MWTSPSSATGLAYDSEALRETYPNLYDIRLHTQRNTKHKLAFYQKYVILRRLFLTLREDAWTALECEEPKDIPVFEYSINSPIASKILNRKAMTGYGGEFRGKITFEMLKSGKRYELVKRYCNDTSELYSRLRFNIVPTELVWGSKYPKIIEVEKNTWIVRDKEGDEFRKYKWIPESDILSQIDSSMRRDGLEGLERRVTQPEESEIVIDPKSLEWVRYAVKHLGDRMVVAGDADCTVPVGEDCIPLFLIAMYRKPHLVKRLLDHACKLAIELGKAQIDEGVDAIMGGGDWAYQKGPFFSPKQFREFILPVLKKMVLAFHKGGVPYVKHTDGNVMPIADDFLIRSGVDGYHAIEPRAGMDIGKLKEKNGDRVCLLGNVDCAYTLVSGTCKDVARETIECIKAASYGGGHVLSSSNSIHSGVRINNFITMLNTARKYGHYELV